jgi:hypothetical protein
MEEIKGRDTYLRSVDLTFEALPAARAFLEIAGIDHYLLFSDLEALSLRLIEKNGLMPSCRRTKLRKRQKPEPSAARVCRHQSVEEKQADKCRRHRGVDG